MAVLIECPECHAKQKINKERCSCGESVAKMKKSHQVRYWIQYRTPDGKQRKEYIGSSLKEAKDADGKRKVQKREKQWFDVKPDRTFQELAEWYLNLEKVRTLASYRRKQGTLKMFNEEFGDMVVNKIKPVDIENYQLKRKNEERADATIDQHISDMLTVIYKAYENDLITGEAMKAFKRVKKLLKKNANARDRILSSEEFDRLMAAAAPHLRPVIAVGYYAGLRLGEILPLTWNKVDLKAGVIRLEATDTKDHEARTVPICGPLYRILKGIPRRAIYADRVFLYDGQPFKEIYGAMATACEKAGIAYGRFAKNGFTFHDLRHTFNTNMRKAGVAESVIMAITGHATREMFDRYNTIDPGDRKDAVDRLENFLENVTQTVTQKG